MILQALYAYYLRKCKHADPRERLPAFGLEEKEIPFIVELSAEGNLLGITDTRQGDGKKKVARRYLVPKGVKRSSGVAANLLWDTAEYVLGIDTRGRPERVAKQHAAFRQRIADLPETARSDAGIQALERFYANGGVALLTTDPCWPEILASNPVLSFRLHNDDDLICQRPDVVPLSGGDDEPGESSAVCLITGELSTTERLHTAIKGVWGAQSSGATLVSFNLDAFVSFNKQQGDNAPVSPIAAFAYTTALNHLLDRNSRQRIQVGDASTVFWAQQEDAEVESAFAAIFGEADDPDARTEQVRGVLSAVHSGQFDGGRGENRFYVLGLAPNAARIAVRFWQAAPLREIAQRIRQWFDDLKMVRANKDPEYPSLFRLLAACAQQGKSDNIPPNLGGDLIRAILSGGPFPASWLNAAVQRCRAEQSVTYLRAAAIKACLNRSRRASDSLSDFSFIQEFSDMLDLENPHPAYRLGRLFAVLEKIQEEANPGLNATIRERYYGAASSNPVAVFTTLLRLKNHHLAKLSNRRRVVNFERLLGEILDGVTDFPRHLRLPDQGRFSLGYYHQRQDFFTKSTPSEASTQGDLK
ncbi:MAG TPA: type I-C CRISPR-associated protein Cas8c/Csd1 [Accumulibacter sp.]|nr:type I-C CRISPR-associated protein Cas8c/Csd1 [Accumulibacter sp.]HMW17384.1 type I-C CRISPR-associated protein Cas8c/Csd1 [Accumulibacter sp.]HMX23403.1 type I-C CRISPR-associated protein Cas8c/Csd1 [Accumulibacter sp.]HMY06816.1 type I-C CRISPR-associated protein Cas8c/Csd1 [Accumulibacter sp.]HNC17002.1 type I-C CRISPR-associated protein Cas8c/Csd1 [Accumulibacter sp.]